MSRDRSFLGTGWDFPPTFLPSSGSVRMVSDEDDIRSSLRVLLSTAVGERRMLPQFGCNLGRLVFEKVDVALETYMKDLVETAILYFEPRIIVQGVQLLAQPEEGRIDIDLQYLIASTNTRQNYVYPFYLAEGTEINW